MIVVSDTSALSNLAIVDHLWLLKTIYQSVIVPDVVASELADASNPTISAILQLDWIQTQSLANSQLANQLQQERGLDAGEANAIALALELQADDLLIDERLGRQEAIRLGLSIIGILGILLVAKQRNLIPHVQPVMDTLINKAGFRVSPQLYKQVLVLAQELLVEDRLRPSVGEPS
jgi:predicted nucleic acid-binding protein